MVVVIGVYLFLKRQQPDTEPATDSAAATSATAPNE